MHEPLSCLKDFNTAALAVNEGGRTWACRAIRNNVNKTVASTATESSLSITTSQNPARQLIINVVSFCSQDAMFFSGQSTNANSGALQDFSLK